MNLSEIMTFLMISIFLKSSGLGFKSKIFFLSHFYDDILTLGFGSLDPFIFTDPSPVSQNVADPNPKH